ncbi:MAG: leucine-rich repeat protein [Clostridia bacterium]|nr:leucine-rich repeat protein [Clostridia bacterium]
MMKLRYLLVLLALILTLSLLACGPQENNPPAPGTTESGETASSAPETTGETVEPPPADVPGYTYTVSGNEATITGYTGEDKDLVIPSYAGGVPVTAISTMAFANRHEIVSVSLPGTLKDTGLMSFFGCSSLKRVVMDEGIEEIARGSFNECSALIDIVFPSTLRVIGDVAFQGSDSLTRISLPDALTSIGYRAFANSGLTAVVTPESCTTIEQGAFAQCRSLKSCEIRGSIQSVSRTLFQECLSLETVILPMSIDSVGEYAFSRCESLKELDLGMVDYFHNFALWGCKSLEKVYLHTTKMDRICNRVFAFVPNLKNIYYAGTMESWTGMRRIDDWNESLPFITINADWNGEK